jgi:hypothetical protein
MKIFSLQAACGLASSIVAHLFLNRPARKDPSD